MCKYFKISRNAYYKSLKVVLRKELEESLILEMVHSVRATQPRVGGKKLYLHLSSDLHSLGKIGRDKFFTILRKNNLLVERKKSYIKTTNSYHRVMNVG